MEGEGRSGGSQGPMKERLSRRQAAGHRSGRWQVEGSSIVVPHPPPALSTTVLLAFIYTTDFHNVW